MIQILKTQGWLVVAAALTIGLSACTSDDFVTGEQQLASGAKGLTVTVGAGFADDASTRSAVVYDNTAKTRTLTFTEGDRLFVQGTVGEMQMDENYMSYYEGIFYGLLTMVEGSLSQDSKSAKFTGDLTILTPKNVNGMYEYEKNVNAIDEFEGKDPLSMSPNVMAYLVHKDAVEDKDFFVDVMEPITSFWNISFCYQRDWASDANTLMTTKIEVGNYEDAYDAEKKSFKLVTNSGPIFNCAISGLKPSTSYHLYYYSNPEWFGDPFLTPIKADASGKTSFAFFGYNQDHYYLKFEPLTADGEVDADGDVMYVNLGTKELNNMTVYNITKTATTDSGDSGDSGDDDATEGFETPLDGGNW